MHVRYTYPRLTKSAKSLGVRLALNACELHIPQADQERQESGCEVCSQCMCVTHTQADQEHQESGCEVCSQCMCVTHTKSAKSLGVRLALNACALHIPRLTKSAKSLGVRLALNACALHIPQADQERQESGCEVCSQCM